MNTTERAIDAMRALLAKHARFSGGAWDKARAALAAYEAERAAPAEPVPVPPFSDAEHKALQEWLAATPAAPAPAREALIRRLRSTINLRQLDADTEQAILDAIDALSTPAPEGTPHCTKKLNNLHMNLIALQAECDGLRQDAARWRKLLAQGEKL